MMIFVFKNMFVYSVIRRKIPQQGYPCNLEYADTTRINRTIYWRWSGFS